MTERAPLIERLRDLRYTGQEAMRVEAASELARLRGILQYIIYQDQKLDHLDKPQDGHFARIARRALGEEARGKEDGK